MSTHDVFRPHRQPAQAIYDAFQMEAEKRRGRSVEEWLKAERQAVLAAASQAAEQMGLAVPTMEQVILAEHCAMGHVNYGAKWAYGIAESMHKAQRATAGPRRRP